MFSLVPKRKAKNQRKASTKQKTRRNQAQSKKPEEGEAPTSALS
jgi:hypothetical protein